MNAQQKERLRADITAMFLIVSMKGDYDEIDIDVMEKAICENLLK